MVACKNANILGKPGQGIHSLRLGGVALVDLLLTLAVAIGLSYIPKSPPLTIWIIFLLLLAILVHAGFCTDTSVNKWIYSGYNKWICVVVLGISALLIILLQSHLK